MCELSSNFVTLIISNWTSIFNLYFATNPQDKLCFYPSWSHHEYW